MTLVVDTSVFLALCFPEAGSAMAERVIDAIIEEGAIVPAIWWFEVRNVLLVKERKKQISARRSRVFLDQMKRLPIRVDLHLADEELMELARKHRLTSYDAAFLELASRNEATLATFDAELARAAASERVEVFGR